MATKKRAKTKKVKKRETRAERVSKKELEERNSFIKVIGTIIALFITIFIALSNFSLCGSIGNVIRSIVLSCFGTYGYFFPIVMGVSILISLFNNDRKTNLKIYALLFLYIALICLTESLIHDFEIEPNISEALDISIKKAKNYFSFASDRFSGGVVGTGIAFLTFKAFGKVGSIATFGTISLITFILLFGLGISKDIVQFLKAVVFFIPNIIKRIRDIREENAQIEIDNDNILKNTIEKSKKANLEVTYDKGFNVYVDNKKVDYYKANNAFISFKINKGNHDIKIIYKAPYKSIGCIISFVRIVSFISIVIYEDKKCLKKESSEVMINQKSSRC